MRKLLFQNLLRLPLTVAAPAPSEQALAELGARVDQAARRRLGRSLSIREVDAGSCNGCELEIHALNNAYYNLEGRGIKFVASPRHADMLLVTGPVTKNMENALRIAYDCTPDPKLVVAVGDCGCGCGEAGQLFNENYATCGPVDNVVAVDVRVPGCPPTPLALMQGILTAVKRR